jgi:hypothetical protein
VINLNAIYFFLFLLLITGGSAAMAKNDYGIELMVWSFAGYAMASLIASLVSMLNKRKPLFLSIEYIALFVIFGIISLRISLIRFPYVELAFSTASLILVLVYTKHVLELRKGMGNKPLTIFLSLFYSSIVFYLMAMAINPMSDFYSEIIGLLAIIVLILALGSTLRIRSIVIKDKVVSLGKFLSKQYNNAVMLISLLGLYSIYSIFMVLDLLPDIHSRNMPEGYYELVEKADKGLDQGVDGNYEFQIYKEHHDRFFKNRGLQE